MAFAPTSKGVWRVGSFGGARSGQSQGREWDEGTARDHMQLCTEPAWKSAHSRGVGSFGLALGHPKAQPQGLLPTGAVGLQCGPCSWSPKLLLGPQKMLLRGRSGSGVPK